MVHFRIWLLKQAIQVGGRCTHLTLAKVSHCTLASLHAHGWEVEAVCARLNVLEGTT